MTRIISIFCFTLLYHSVSFSTAKCFDVILEIRNHQFVENIVTAPSGKKIRLIIKNHDNTIEEFESHTLKRERIVPAKGEIKIILAPQKPGKYQFFGEFHPDTAKGTLIIE